MALNCKLCKYLLYTVKESWCKINSDAIITEGACWNFEKSDFKEEKEVKKVKKLNYIEKRLDAI